MSYARAMATLWQDQGTFAGIWGMALAPPKFLLARL
jgi:hypothetical protein